MVRNDRIPEEHTLPLNIKGQELLSGKGFESDIYRLDILDGRRQTRNIVLKESRQPRFASAEAMKKQQRYYDFLKKHRTFGKYVVNTSFFLARRTGKEPARNYKLEKNIQGIRLDEISDGVIAADKELVRQLIDFIDDVIVLLGDLLKYPEFSKLDLYADKKSFANFFRANFLQNPRFSGNVLISPKQEIGSQRIHFVDPSEIRSAAKPLRDLDQLAKPITTKMQINNLLKWKKKLQNCPEV